MANETTLNDVIDRFGATAMRIAEERNALMCLIKRAAEIKPRDYVVWTEWQESVSETLEAMKDGK